MKIRDRIKDFRRVKAADLRPNPRNWRTQQDALRGLLAEVGYADALLARELPDGTVELGDGHLRAETTPDLEVPVLVLDVTAEEAEKVLAALDPLAAMARADKERLDQLLQRIDTGSEALQAMLDELAKDNGISRMPEVTEDDVPGAARRGYHAAGRPLDSGRPPAALRRLVEGRGRRSAPGRRHDPAREYRSAVQRQGRTAEQQRDRRRPLVIPGFHAPPVSCEFGNEH